MTAEETVSRAEVAGLLRRYMGTDEKLEDSERRVEGLKRRLEEER